MKYSSTFSVSILIQSTFLCEQQPLIEMAAAIAAVVEVASIIMMFDVLVNEAHE